MQLNLLPNIELLPQLDQDAVDRVVIVGVVTPCCGEVQDDQVVLASGFHELLVVLEPLDQEGLFAHPALSLDDQGFVFLG